MKEYLQSAEHVIGMLQSNPQGIDATEADLRKQKYGLNKLKEAKKDSLIKRFMKQLADPMIIILICAAGVSLATALYSGESVADVIIIMAVVLINAVLGVYQESKAEKAIEALQKMTAATSRVLREGHVHSVHSDELTVGDVILLEAGDAIPADGRIIECASMKVEEAALTGESVPVNKQAEAISEDNKTDIPLGDRKNMVYMGSTMAYGRGKAVITAIGMDTEMGKIADALSKAEDGDTPLQKKLAQLGKILSITVLGICLFIFAFTILKTGDFSGANLLNTFMVAVSLAVAAIPEGLSAVVTIVLSIGVTNMSKRNAVIRRLTAVETLGCAQIICSDKTGTLTQNKMTVTQSITADEKMLARAMALCSDAVIEQGEAVGEPTECALVSYALKSGLPKDMLVDEEPRIAEVPFDSSRKMMTTLHRKGDNYVSYTKGAPDEVLKLCTHALTDKGAVPMDESLRAHILAQNKAMADKALRVLMAAYRQYDAKPSELSSNGLEKELTYIGLTGMIDPVRPEVKQAVDECRSAGIRAIMITGDHIDTAVAIAMELGIIDDPSQAISGSELSQIPEDVFREDVKKYSVYARVQPEHKVRIVEAWRALGKVTAMTGDGVNDAPSIKSADIGIGMGITGTDVTKNVADMVLADDNFATIVTAVEEGRRIYDNIRKSIQFLLSSNLSEVLSIFFATVLGFTILKPVHILWINLITDSLPALALGMEGAEADIMKRQPRSSKESIFSGGVLSDTLYQGVLVTAVTLAAYFIGHYMESGLWEITNSADGTTMAFLTLSMAEIFHSFNLRSRTQSIFGIRKQNPYLFFAMAASLILTTAVIYVPFLSNAFGFEHISATEYAVAMGLAFSVVPIVEGVKLVKRVIGGRKAKQTVSER